MPIYEYECRKCHHKLDLMQKISDPPALQCPQCLEDNLVRLVSAADFQLKGQGWYATDFKNKNVPSNKKDSVQDSGQDSKEPTTQSTEKPNEITSSTEKKTQEKGESN